LKFLSLLFLFFIYTQAKEHYAKVEPYEVKSVSSNVSGEVTFADEKREGKVLDGDAYLKIDDMLDHEELSRVIKNIESLKKTLEIDEDMLKNYALIVEKKEQNYKRVKELKMKAELEKDRELYDFLNSQNQYLSLKKEIQNLKIELNNLTLRKAQLQKSINDKTKSAKGFVLYELLVKEGEVVSSLTAVAKIADVSYAKLTLFLNEEELQEAKESKIFLDSIETNYKLDKIYNIADSKHLSSYKVEILIDPPKIFSNLLKIEFKR
jgi:multidrug efflux pump subunit AcrA (membrane-fusion protein)